jgi:predicted PurR-regulated permease PerM
MRLTTSFSGQKPPQPFGAADLYRAALAIIGTLIAFQLLWSARILVLTAFLGILFGLSAANATTWLTARTRLNRNIAAALVVLGTVALLVGIFAWTGPTLVEQSQDLRTKLPEALTKLELWLVQKQPRLLDSIAPPTVDGTSRLMAAFTKHAPALTDFAFGLVQSTLVVAAGVVMVVFLALYIAADPDVYRRGVLYLVPVARRDRMATLLTALGQALRTWFATQLIAMLVIGIVTTILLAVLGVRAAFPLGVIAGIFEFIPNIGPMLSAVPAVLMGFVDSPQKALVVVGVYWGIQFLENNLLIPYLMKEQLDLPPALTLLAQVLMAYVFGFLGLFVAIPMLAVVVVAVRTFWVEDDLTPLPTIEMQVPELPPGGEPTPAKPMPDGGL